MGFTLPMRVQTLQQWSKETSLKVSTLRRAIKRGHLHAKVIGQGRTSPYYITERDLNGWLDARSVRRA